MAALDFKQIKAQVDRYREQGLSLFTTSSFQTHSLVLLHVLSRIDRSIPVVFINTGFHFPETIQFRNQITSLLGLNTVDLRSGTSRLEQIGSDGRFLFASDPDRCCQMNKTFPLEPWLLENDVWINGVRADQSAARSAMKVEQPAPRGVTRFHPMLHWNAKMIHDYIREHELPSHPLDSKGYISIGCEPCTRRVDTEMLEREARWYGLSKSECGLHTELISNEAG